MLDKKFISENIAKIPMFSLFIDLRNFPSKSDVGSRVRQEKKKKKTNHKPILNTELSLHSF